MVNIISCINNSTHLNVSTRQLLLFQLTLNDLRRFNLNLGGIVFRVDRIFIWGFGVAFQSLIWMHPPIHRPSIFTSCRQSTLSFRNWNNIVLIVFNNVLNFSSLGEAWNVALCVPYNSRNCLITIKLLLNFLNLMLTLLQLIL